MTASYDSVCWSMVTLVIRVHIEEVPNLYAAVLARGRRVLLFGQSYGLGMLGD